MTPHGLIVAGDPQPDLWGTQGEGSGFSVRSLFKISPLPFVSALCGLPAVMSTVFTWQPRPLRSSFHGVLFPSAFRLSGCNSMFSITSTCEERGVEEHGPCWHQGKCGHVLGGRREVGSQQRAGGDTCVRGARSSPWQDIKSQKEKNDPSCSASSVLWLGG